MIVDRATFNVKPSKMDEIVELVKAEAKLYPAPHAMRIYTPNVAAFDTLVLEWEFEDMAEQVAFWEGWTASEGFGEKWQECAAGGGRSEIWNLAE